MRLLPVWLLLVVTAGYAQLPNVSFERITDLDGLPSRSVSCAVEDSSGFMWFGTRKSLARYDGYQFQSVVNELINGVAIAKNGQLYSSTNQEKLVRVATRTLTSKTIVGRAEAGAYNTFIDSFGNVWFSDPTSINRYEPATGKVSQYPMTKTTWVFHKGSFVEDSHRNVWVLGMEVGLFRFDRKLDKLLCQFGDDCPRLNPISNRHLVLRTGFIDKADVIWIPAEGRGLLRYDTNTGQATLYSSGSFVLLTACEGWDERGNRIIWVGSDKGLGVFRPESGQFAFYDNLIPQRYGVNDIVQSRRTGILWVCTTEGLLKYDPNNQFISTNRIVARTQAVNAIVTDNADTTGQTVWLGAAYQGLYKWNRATNKTTFYKFPPNSGELEVNWIVQDKEHTLWVGCNQWQHLQMGKPSPADNRFEGILRFNAATGQYLSMPFSNHHSFFSAPFYSLGMLDRKGRFWIINHYEGVHVVDPRTGAEAHLWPKEAHEGLFANGNWVMDVFEDSRGQVWLTTYQGTFRFDEAGRNFHKTDTGPGMIRMAEAPDGNLWAVGWSGLVKLDPTGRILRTWTTRDGLYDPECRRVAVDNQNRVWIGTYDGLHLFDPPTNTFRRFTVNDGLITNDTEMGFLLTGDHKLLVGNKGGWNTLDMTALANSTMASRLSLTELRVNNKAKDVDWAKPVVLAPDETALSFDFSALNYRKSTDNNYAYYLEGLEKDWINAGHTHQAVYTNLDPKAYVFHARLLKQPGAELRLPFSIRPVFYTTWWFKSMVALLLLGLLAFIYRSRMSYRMVKAELKLEEATLRQKEASHNEELAAYQLRLSRTEMAALRAQMNPHFIFNCINSIKLYTLQNDTDRASDYLNKFARLIRLVLENSRAELVTLHCELEALQLYIELEAMRFKQKVQFHIHLDPRIDQQFVNIPPLLLQPYVENAIWHGLMHKLEGGTVRIDLTQPTDGQLCIEITDDGIGRARAGELKSKSADKHKSFGMQVTADRIRMINQLYNTQTTARIDDLVDSLGEPCGTKVTLEIPI